MTLCAGIKQPAVFIIDAQSVQNADTAAEKAEPARHERMSLWRELYIARMLPVRHLLSFPGGLGACIRELSRVCAGSKRKRKPRLCIFSSA
jgi:hypothetical protein